MNWLSILTKSVEQTNEIHSFFEGIVEFIVPEIIGIIELMGIGPTSINYWPLMGKLNSLKYLAYEYFRKTIFECMNLIGGLDVPDELY